MGEKQLKLAVENGPKQSKIIQENWRHLFFFCQLVQSNMYEMQCVVAKVYSLNQLNLNSTKEVSYNSNSGLICCKTKDAKKRMYDNYVVTGLQKK